MRVYRSINLRLWLPVIILGAFALMMTFSSLWRYQEQTQRLEADAIKDLQQRLAHDQRHLESLLRMNHQGLAAEIIAELGAVPGIEFVVLMDEHEQIIYSSQPLWVGKNIRDALPANDTSWLPESYPGRQLNVVFSPDANTLNAYQTVNLGTLPGQIRANLDGILALQYSLRSTKAEVWRAVRNDGLVNVGIGTLVMLLLMLLLDRWLARPLSYLRDVVKNISLGEFNSAIKIVGEGELASLAVAVRRMQRDLAKINRKQAQSQKELRQFKYTLDQTLDGVIIANTKDFRFLYVNQGIQEQLGYTEAELLKMSPLDIKPDRDPNFLAERMRPLLDGSVATMRFESEHRHKDGRNIPVEIFLQLIHQPNEESRFVAIVRDMSTRHSAEAELRASEARFRVLFEQAAVGVAVIETETCRFVRINKKYADIVGYSVDDMLSMDFVMITYEEDLAPGLANIERLKSGEIREFTMEKRYICKDGSVCWVNLTVSPMWDTGAAVDYHVAVVEDITARKQSDALLNSQMVVLEMIAQSEPLDHTMTILINAVEELMPDMLCSVLLLDASGKHLHHCAAPSLPTAYMAAINGTAIGEAIGSCGTAAFRAEMVIVPDIAHDPLWVDYAELALAHDLYACWSTPIFSATQQVLGTFAVYYRQPCYPSAHHQHFIAMVTHTAAIAIERQQSEAALKDAAEYTQIILDNVVDGIVTTDAHGKLESYNNSAARIFGYSAEEVLGKSINQLTPGLHRETGTNKLDTLSAEAPARVLSRRREMEGLRKEGTSFPLEVSLSRVLHHGQVKLIGLMSDISERRRHEEKIERLAFYDPLTELPNRRLLSDRLLHALATSARSGALGALLLLDLDHFKNLNDTHGHDAGDLLLCQVAQRLSRCVREGDTVARLGGDEFVVILEDLSHDVQEAAARAKAVGEHILSLLSQTYILEDIDYFSSPSIGITLFSTHEDTVDALLKRADVAMYQAKAAGRNNLQFFDSTLQASLAARTALEADMRMGLVQHQFLLYYQPQVNAAGQITSAEALVRWQHPEKGMISPMDFIPLAEQSGFILPLGQWVLHTACEQLLLWSKNPLTKDLVLAINVSARQFRQIGFVEQILDVILQTGVDPTRIKLELTETLLVNNLDDVRVKMTALKSCGVGFALDDFGTGYSSLAYLRQLPLDQLKIDQSFVRDVLIDPNDAVIARTIIGLAISLGLEVIAEGVESEGQRAFLAENGCYAYQGHLFSPALPVEGFEQLLASGLTIKRDVE